MINCDGATFKKQKKSGIGVVIWDNNGLVMVSMSKQLPPLYTTLEIEPLAASTALEFALDMGFGQAVLETDSLVLANALINDSPYLSSDGLLIGDIRF